MRKTDKLLKIYEIDTYPQTLLNLVAENRNLFCKYNFDPESDNLVGDFDKWWSKNSSSRLTKEFMKAFLKESENVWIEGFHITRTFPDKNFLNEFYLSQGLQFPDLVFQYKYFKEVFARIDCSEDVARMFFNAFSERLPRTEDRMRTISVFSYPSEFVLHLLDNGYVSLYGGEINVFGEIGKVMRHRLPHWTKTLFEQLERNTCPYILQLRFSLKQVYKGTCEYPLDFVINELVGIIASKYFNRNEDKKYLINMNNSVFCAQLGRQIPSEDILGIYSIEEWEQMQYSSKKKY